MRRKIVALVAFFVISLFIFIYVLSSQFNYIESSSLHFNTRPSKPVLFFRASSDILFNIYQIPKLLPPKERLKYQKPFQYIVQKSERLLFYKLLHIFDKTLKDNGIGYFMASGTLFGSYRHHDFIPWDDDLDVFVNKANRKQLKNIFKMLNISNLVYFVAGNHDKIYLDNESISTNNYGWKWPYIDVSFYDLNKTHIYDIAKTYGKYDTYPKSIVFPLSTRPFHTFNLPSPKDTFAYLVWSYGYTDICEMNKYLHMIEDRPKLYNETQCKKLKDKYPWVKRSKLDNDVIEELYYKKKLIQRIKVNEPKYAISRSFSLKLQDGYVLPKNIDFPLK